MELKNCHSDLSLNLHHSVNWKGTINILLFYVLMRVMRMLLGITN